jgi:hypothetical protein
VAAQPKKDVSTAKNAGNMAFLIAMRGDFESIVRSILDILFRF